MSIVDMVRSAGAYSRESLSAEYVTQILRMLSSAVADEVQAWYQYRFVSPFLTGTNSMVISSAFESLADDELEDHCYGLLTRISQLGGDISLISSPEQIMQTAKCPYFTPIPPYDVRVSLEQNIKSEECAIRTYRDILDYCSKNDDVVTYRLVLRILADEEDHLSTLTSFRDDLTNTRP